MNFNLEIISPEKKIFSGEVEKVTLPSTEGIITVLARHMPLVAPLMVGEVELKTKDEVINLSIGKGVFFVSGNSATLLIEDVSSSDQISEEKVIEAKMRAEELIKKGIKGEEKLQAMYMLRKSLVDLNMIRKRKKGIYRG